MEKTAALSKGRREKTSTVDKVEWKPCQTCQIAECYIKFKGFYYGSEPIIIYIIHHYTCTIFHLMFIIFDITYGLFSSLFPVRHYFPFNVYNFRHYFRSSLFSIRNYVPFGVYYFPILCPFVLISYVMLCPFDIF
jgi:hypothetical protein